MAVFDDFFSHDPFRHGLPGITDGRDHKPAGRSGAVVPRGRDRSDRALAEFGDDFGDRMFRDMFSGFDRAMRSMHDNFVSSFLYIFSIQPEIYYSAKIFDETHTMLIILNSYSCLLSFSEKNILFEQVPILFSRSFSCSCISFVSVGF